VLTFAPHQAFIFALKTDHLEYGIAPHSNPHAPSYYLSETEFGYICFKMELSSGSSAIYVETEAISKFGRGRIEHAVAKWLPKE
jgi:hypothetical protein